MRFLAARSPWLTSRMGPRASLSSAAASGGGSMAVLATSSAVGFTLGESPFTIVGVMPPDLDYPTGVEVWRTTSSVPTTGPFGDAARREVNLIGRLRPGVSVEQATSEITSLSQWLDAATPANAMRGLVPVVRPFADVVVGDVRATMLALFGAVGLVLLIACANVANLLLLRGEARRGEMALRSALGAGRARILQQVFAEGLVLSLLAGIIGFAVAWSSLQTLVTLVPDGVPRLESIRIDQAVALFALAVVLVTALLASVAPALLPSRGDLVSPLRSGAPAIAGGSSAPGRHMLVVAQVALAVTVLAPAGVLIHSVLRLQAVELGLPADRLVLLDLHLPRARYAERQQHGQFLDGGDRAARGRARHRGRNTCQRLPVHRTGMGMSRSSPPKDKTRNKPGKPLAQPGIDTSELLRGVSDSDPARTCLHSRGS